MWYQQRIAIEPRNSFSNKSPFKFQVRCHSLPPILPFLHRWLFVVVVGATRPGKDEGVRGEGVRERGRWRKSRRGGGERRGRFPVTQIFAHFTHFSFSSITCYATGTEKEHVVRRRKASERQNLFDGTHSAAIWSKKYTKNIESVSD